MNIFVQDEDDDIIDTEPSCSTFNSNEHAYSYSKFFYCTKIKKFVFKIKI